MNTTMPAAIDSAVVVQSEQAAAVNDVRRDDLTVFFSVGIFINIVMITAYFVWAYKQWGKSGAKDE